MTKDYVGVSAQEASRRLCLSVQAFVAWARKKKIPHYGKKSPHEWDWNEIEEKYMGIIKEPKAPVAVETNTGLTNEDIEKLTEALNYFREGFLNHHLNASEFLQLVRRAVSELK